MVFFVIGIDIFTKADALSTIVVIAPCLPYMLRLSQRLEEMHKVWIRFGAYLFFVAIVQIYFGNSD